VINGKEAKGGLNAFSRVVEDASLTKLGSRGRKDSQSS